MDTATHFFASFSLNEMSYRGRFSKGCESCRARKVKVRADPTKNMLTMSASLALAG